ncbi:MAG: LCP family protein [Lachnospiraceae bacterium]|nr:LCP family protein [Lachnospiraceae bacterium]
MEENYDQEVRSLRRERAKRRKRLRIIKYTVVSVLEVLLLVAMCGLYYLRTKIGGANVLVVPEGQTIATNAFVEPSYQERISKQFTTLALFGIDSSENPEKSQQRLVKGSNADVIMLAVIDNETKDVKLVSVFRDTYFYRSDGTFGKINAEATHFGTYSLMQMLNKNYDLDIDGFIAVDWSIVANLVNDMGGLELDIKENMMTVTINGETVPYINGLISQIVQSTGIPSVHIEHTGLQLCDGVQTVAYCRLRKRDSDFMRAQRQREVISKMLVKAKASSIGTLNTMVDHVFASTLIGSSDGSAKGAQDIIDYFIGMVPDIKKIHINDSQGFPFAQRTEMGYMGNCVVPINLEQNVSKLHEYLYGTQNYQCSDYVKNLSETIRVNAGFDSDFNYVGVQ